MKLLKQLLGAVFGLGRQAKEKRESSSDSGATHSSTNSEQWSGDKYYMLGRECRRLVSERPDIQLEAYLAGACDFARRLGLDITDHLVAKAASLHAVHLAKISAQQIAFHKKYAVKVKERKRILQVRRARKPFAEPQYN